MILPKVHVPAQRDLGLVERQARLAPTLLEFARPELVWPMLIHRDDPNGAASIRFKVRGLLAAGAGAPAAFFSCGTAGHDTS